MKYNSLKRCVVVSLTISALALLCAVPARGQATTWDGGGVISGTGVWQTSPTSAGATNWLGDVLPTSTGTAVFASGYAGATITDALLPPFTTEFPSVSVGSIRFTTGAAAYTFLNNSFTFANGGGITVDSGVTTDQIFAGATGTSPGIRLVGSSTGTVRNDGTGLLAIDVGYTSDSSTSGAVGLVFDGSGAIRIGAIRDANTNVTTNVVKNGSGTLTITAGGTAAPSASEAGWYAGTTTLNAGRLNVNAATALGGGTLIINGGSLGNTSGGAVTLSTNNAQTWAGNFSFAGPNDLNLGTGAVSLGAAVRTVTVSSNVLTVGGAISGAGGLTKQGGGTLVLAGANTFTGATSVTGGGLRLDYTTSDTSKLSNAAALTLTNAAVTLAGGSHTELVGSTTLNAGRTTIARDGGSSTLRLGAVTRSAGAVMNVAEPGLVALNTTNTNGIVGGWLTVAGSDWGVNSTNAANGPLTGLASGSYFTSTSGSLGPTTANATVGANTTVGTTTINSLRFGNAAAYTVTGSAATTRTLTSGGILVAPSVGANTSSITGGTLTAGATNLVINQFNTSGSLALDSVVGGSGGVFKTGPGALSLGGSTANTFTGGLSVYEGEVQLAKSGAVNAIVSGPLTIGSGGSVRYSGASTDMIANAVAIQLNGSGFLDFAGATDTVGAVTVNATNAGADAQVLRNTGSGGTLTVSSLTITPDDGFLTTLGSGSGLLALGGNAAFNAAGSGRALITGSLSLGNGNRTFTVADGTAFDDLTISAVITSGTLTKAGAGRLVLAGTNSLAGGMSVSTGELSVSSVSAIGGGLNLAANTIFTVGTSGSLSVGGAIVTDAQSSGGTLNVYGALTTGSSVTIGYSGNANGPGDGTFNVGDGARVSIGGGLTLGEVGNGRLIQGDNSSISVAGTLTVGGAYGSLADSYYTVPTTGTLAITGPGSELRVGYGNSAQGEFTYNNPSAILAVPGSMTVGFTFNSQNPAYGVATLGDSTRTTIGGDLVIANTYSTGIFTVGTSGSLSVAGVIRAGGNNATATLNVNANGMLTTGSSVTIGYSSNVQDPGNGTFTVGNGAQVAIGGGLTLGEIGNGRLIQGDNSSISVAGTLTVGGAYGSLADSYYTVPTTGTLAITGSGSELRVGYGNSARGEFTYNNPSAILAVPGSMTVGFTFNGQSPAYGVATLGDSTRTTIGGDLVIANTHSTGIFTVGTSGSLSVAGVIRAGGNNATATLNVNANGMLTTGSSVTIGYSSNGQDPGNGTFTVGNGAQVAIGGDFTIGGPGNSTGMTTLGSNATLTVTGATAIATAAGSGGTIYINGGTANFAGGASLGANGLLSLNGGAVRANGISGASAAFNAAAGMLAPWNADATVSTPVTLTGTSFTFGSADKDGVARTLTLNSVNLDVSTRVVKAGVGTVVLTNSSGAAILPSGVEIAAGTLRLDRATDAILTGTISGAGNFQKSGVGTLVLSAANTYTGTTTLSAGTLAISADVNISGTATPLVFDGGTLEITGTSLTSLAAGRPTSFVAGKTVGLVIASSSNTFTVGQALDQTTGGLAVSGGGTLVLAGANTFTGTTSVTGGGLRLDYTTSDTSKLSNAAALTLTGAAVTLAGGSHTEAVGSTTLAAGRTTIARSGGSATLQTGTITRSLGGSLDVAQSGLLLVSNTNTNGIVGGWLTVAGSDWGVNSTNAANGSLTGLASGSYFTSTSGSLGPTTANATVGANTTVGTTTINSLRFGNAAAYTVTGSAATTRTLTSGGILVAPSVGANTSSITGGTLTAVATNLVINQFNTSGSLAIDSVVGGSGGVFKTGPGALSLGGSTANTFTGGLSVYEGEVQLAKSGAVNAIVSGSLTIGSGGSVRYSGASTDMIANAVAIQLNGSGFLDFAGATDTVGAVTVNATNAGADAQVLRNTGAGGALTASSLTVTPDDGYATTLGSGSGLLVLNGNGTFNVNGSGRTVIAGGLSLGNGNRTFTVNDGFAADDLTISAAISSGTLTKAGDGTLVLSASNAHTMALSAGRLDVNNASALGTGTFTISGGTIGNSSGSGLTNLGNNAQAWNADFTFAGPDSLDLGTGAVTMSANRTVTVASNTLTVGGTIGGASRNLTKAGSGTLVLSAANIYSGTTRVGAGQLTVGNTLALQNSLLDMATADAGTVVFLQDSTLSGLIGSRPLDAGGFMLSIGNNSVSGTYSGVLTNGGLTKIGTGTLALSAANTYSGGTVLNAGMLSFVNNGLGTSGSVTLNGGTLQWVTGNTQDLSSRLVMVSGSTATLDILGNNVTLATGFGDSSTGALTKLGSGTLVLAGANTYSGTTSINNGTLVIGSGGTTGSLASTSAIAGPAGAALVFNRSDDYGGSFANTIGGGINVTVQGTGTVALTGVNTFSGTTRAGAGRLTVGNALALQNSLLDMATADASTVVFGQSSTLGGLTGSRSLDMGAFTLSIGNSGSSTTYSGGLSGAGGLTKIGTGTLTLSGSNTFMGTTRVGAGQLTVSNASALRNSTLDMNADDTGTVSFSQASTLGGLSGSRNLGMGGSTLSIGNNSASTTYSGTLSGAGGLVKIGTGTLTLSAANTYTGATIVGATGGTDAGILRLTGNGRISSAATTVFAGTLDMTGINQSITSLTLGGGAAATTSGVLTGSGTLTLGGNVTYTATNNPGGGTIAGNLNLGNAARTFDVGNSTATADDLTVSANITSGTLTKAGAGSLVLSGSNSHSGGVTLSAGPLNLGNAWALGTGTFTISGGTIGNSTGADLTVAGNNVQNWNADFTFAGPNALDLGTGSVAMNTARIVTIDGPSLTVGGTISGAGFSLTKQGLGTLLLTASNAYTGATNVGAAAGTDAGILRLTGNGRISSAATTVFAGTLDMTGINQSVTTLTLGGGAAATTSGVLTGSGTLTLGGNVAYTATNNPGGGTIAGNLNLGNAARTFTVGDSTAAADDLTVSANITSGTLTKAGAGSLVLSGSNSHSGGVTLSAGLLNLGNAWALGTGTFTISGGTIGNSTGADLTVAGNNAQVWSGNFTFTGPNALDLGTGSVTLSAARVVTIDGPSLTVGGTISGAGFGITQRGNGTLILTAANTYTGATFVGAAAGTDAGILRLTGNGRISSAATTVYAGTLDMTGINQSITSLVLGGGAAATTSSVLTGSGTLTLGDNVFYTATNNPGGGTIAGNLNLGNAARTFTVGDSTATAADLTVSANITSGTLVKAGAGALVLSGSNSYAGGLTLSAGRLDVNNARALGTGTFTISAASTTLGNSSGAAITNLGNNVQNWNADFTFAGPDSLDLGTGAVTMSVNRTVTVASNTLTVGGTISGVSRNLTKAGSGTLLLTANNTYTGATTVTEGTLAASSIGAGGSASPLGNSSSAINLGSGALAGFLGYTGSGETATRGISLVGNRGGLDAGGTGALNFNGPLTAAGTKTLVLTGTSTAANRFSTAILGADMSVEKTGVGTWLLSGANSFGGSAGTGRLNVLAGTLVADGNAPDQGSGVFGAQSSLRPIVGAADATGSAALLVGAGYTVSRAVEIAAAGTGTQEAILGGMGAGVSEFDNLSAIYLGRSALTLAADSGNEARFYNAWLDGSGGGSPAAAFNVGTSLLSGTVGLMSFVPDSITAVNVRNGTLRLAASGGETLGFATQVTVGSGLGSATLNLANAQQSLASLRFSGSAGTVAGAGAGGVLKFSNNGAPAAVAVLDGTGHDIQSAVALLDATTFNVAAGGRLGVSGAISGGSGFTLTKTGLGRLDLSAANTYSGNTTVSAGRLVLGTNGSFAASSAIIVGDAGSSDAVLDLTAKTGGYTFGPSQTLGGGGRLELASSGTLTVAGLFSPGNSPGLFTYDGGTTLLTGTTLMEIFGTSRATLPSHGSGFYDAVNVVDGGILTLGGNLQLTFSSLFADDTTFDLFSRFDTATLAGNFTSVNVTGSFYNGLVWTQPTSNLWKSSETAGGQGLEFNATTGTLAVVIVVPEPGALALAGVGVALAVWTLRRRRR